jgi:hypothetical protein
MADVGLEAAVLAARALSHLLPAHARVAGGPGLVCELAERHSIAVAARRWMARGQDHVHAVAEQFVGIEPCGQAQRLVRPLVAEHEVHVAEREGGQRLLRLRLNQLAAQPRRVARECLHRGDRQPKGDRLKAGNPTAAADGARGRRQVRLSERRALEQRLRVLHQHEGSVGQAHAAAGSLEQGHAHLALQHGELLRDGRGGELERVRNCGDGPALAQLAQQPEAS